MSAIITVKYPLPTDVNDVEISAFSLIVTSFQEFITKIPSQLSYLASFANHLLPLGQLLPVQKIVYVFSVIPNVQMVSLESKKEWIFIGVFQEGLTEIQSVRSDYLDMPTRQNTRKEWWFDAAKVYTD